MSTASQNNDVLRTFYLGRHSPSSAVRRRTLPVNLRYNGRFLPTFSWRIENKYPTPLVTTSIGGGGGG
jgi:hypothetical protein